MWAPTDLSVFIDFDGTMTRTDVGVHLLERLASPLWREIDADYVAGRIGSRECLLREWALLRPGEARLREVAAEVGLDPASSRLIHELHEWGAEVTVVSDGFGFYTETPCRQLGVDVLTNRVDFSTHTLEFPNMDGCCPCASCGTCKQAPIKAARRRGRKTVVVGDGASDRKAALIADVVFAKGGLAEWCEQAEVPFTPFDTLADVHLALLQRFKSIPGADESTGGGRTWRHQA